MARVALTFDNGPDPEGTPRVLDALARRRARSTFFVLGERLGSPVGRTWAERILDAGHRLGNHTYSHTVPLGEDPRPDAVALELERTRALLDELSVSDRLFRPFGRKGRLGPHLLSRAAFAWLIEHRMTCVLWTSVPGDFRDPEGWVERALDDCEGSDDVLMVLHDAHPGAMTRLDRFLGTLLDRGHTLTDAFPRRCLPVIDGVPQPDHARYVAGLSAEG